MYLPPILGYLSPILGRMFVAKNHGVNRLMLFHSWANQSNTYTRSGPQPEKHDGAFHRDDIFRSMMAPFPFR